MEIPDRVAVVGEPPLDGWPVCLVLYSAMVTIQCWVRATVKRRQIRALALLAIVVACLAGRFPGA